MIYSRDIVISVRRALSAPAAIAERLGLKIHERHGSYVIVPCPIHAERTPSCSIYRDGDSSKFKCHGCKEAGDLVDLVGAVRGLKNYRDALAVACELAGLHSEADALRRGREVPKRSEPVAPLEPEPERDYPLPREVSLLWSACIPVTQDAEVSALLEARGIPPRDVAAYDLGRALHPSTHPSSVPAWAKFKGKHPVSRSWIETGHRLILPVYDSDGGMRSVRAWRVVDGDTPKRVPPAGWRASGLVLANGPALRLLRENASPGRVVVTEGEPDMLARSVLSPLDPVFGVMSGSWHSGFAARVPFGSRVFVRTHLDPAGDKYAEEITESLADRAVVSRLQREEAA